MKLPDMFVLHPPISLRFEYEPTWIRGVPQTITVIIKNHCVEMVEISTRCHRSSAKWLIGSMATTSRCVFIGVCSRCSCFLWRKSEKHSKLFRSKQEVSTLPISLSAAGSSDRICSTISLFPISSFRKVIVFCFVFVTNTARKLLIKIRIERFEAVVASHQHHFFSSTHIEKHRNGFFGRHIV